MIHRSTQDASRRTQMFLLLAGLLLSSSSPLSAQTVSRNAATPPTSRPWELEVHGGGLFGGQPTAGTPLATWPVGTSFTNVIGRATRAATSWSFGDGAVLLNQALAGFTAIPVSPRITPLDSALRASNLHGGKGIGFGARVGRRLTSRVRAEFGLETATRPVEFDKATLDAFEATRASFTAVFNGIIASGGGGFTNPNVSATTTLTAADGRRQTLVTGAVLLDLPTTGRIAAHVTAGLGASVKSGNAPTATMTGNYRLTVGLSPINETDVVRLHFVEKDRVLVSLFGGGVRYFVSPRHGIRADVRAQVSGNSIDTLVDATPNSAQSTPINAVASATTPSLVFSNFAGARTSLSDPSLKDLTTFVGTGHQVQTNVTVGYFFRF